MKLTNINEDMETVSFTVSIFLPVATEFFQFFFD